MRIRTAALKPGWTFALILATYLLLALGYGAINPLFEAPDEHNHYFTAQAIAETGRLPFLAEEPDKWLGQEAAQPPLYYLLGSLLIAPIDTAGAGDKVWPNPFVRLGDAGSPTNVNAFVHGPEENWPWRGHVLAAHLLRIFSTVLGLGTLGFVYASGRLVWPSAPGRALLATALVAFLPQFAFIHGAVSNDALITLLSAAVLWQLLRLWLDKVNHLRLLALGVTIGLAILSKTAGLLLLAYALLVLSLLAWRDRQWHLLVTAAGLVAIPALTISGWLLWRNWILYGDITAATQFVQYFGGSRDYTLFDVLSESSGLWLSLFAVFGWFNVRAPEWVYWIWNGLVLAAVIGAVWQLVGGRGAGEQEQPTTVNSQQSTVNLQTCKLANLQTRKLANSQTRKQFLAALLFLWILLVYAGLVRFMLMTPAAQGRLLFPALVPMALALAYGLSGIGQRWLYWAAPGMALLTSVYCLLIVIPGTYARPLLITEAELPATAAPLYAELGQGLELVAVELETQSAQPDDWVWLTLYWRAHVIPDEAPEFVLVLFGRYRALAGKLQSYHGGGLYPANLWQPAEIIADRLAVHLESTIVTPTQVRVNVSLVDGPVGPDVASLKVVPRSWPALETEVVAQLGEGVELAAVELAKTTARPGEIVPLAVRWQVRNAPGRDLTTFVHLGEPTEPPLAQGDSPPLAGDYPTRFWEPGEVIDDAYSVPIPSHLPAGTYPVWIGLYDPETTIRLPLVVDGARQSCDAYLVGWLTIVVDTDKK